MCHLPRWRYLALAVFAMAWGAQAQDISGAGFYPFRGNARSIGLAGAYTAVSDDTAGLHFNPAGMAQLTHRQAEVTLKLNSNGENYMHLAYIEPVREGKFGGGFSYLRGSDGTGRSDKVFQFTYGQYAYPGLAFGANLRYQSVKAGATKSDGFSFDVGALYSPPGHKEWSFGIVALDLNEPTFRGIGKAKRIFNAGIAYRPDKQTVLDLDWYDIGSNAKRGGVRFGAERELTENIAVRAGVAEKTFAVGLSLTYKYFTLDYGFQRIEHAPDLNMLSVVANF